MITLLLRELDEWVKEERHLWGNKEQDERLNQKEVKKKWEELEHT